MLLFIVRKILLFISNSRQNWTPLFTSQATLVTSHKTTAFVEVHIRGCWFSLEVISHKILGLKTIELT